MYITISLLFIYFLFVQKVDQITRDNISKLMDRGDNLNDLQARTGKQQQTNKQTNIIIIIIIIILSYYL